jgi:hypothetical protein
MVKMSQNIGDLHLHSAGGDDSFSNRSVNRSKTGNKLKITSAQLDVISHAHKDESDDDYNPSTYMKFEHHNNDDVCLLVSACDRNIKILDGIGEKNSVVNVQTLQCNFNNSNKNNSYHNSIIKNCNNLSITSNHNNMTVPVSPINPLTTSKSENNIFDKNNMLMYNTNSPHTFNVVSLSDLSDDAHNNHDEVCYMNDLSKTQVLNRLSDEKFDGNIANRF